LPDRTLTLNNIDTILVDGAGARTSIRMRIVGVGVVEEENNKEI